MKAKKLKLAKRPVPKNNSLFMHPFIIMGLGNPGSRYALTRHNAGYQVIDLMLNKPSLRLRRRFFASYYYSELPRESSPEQNSENMLERSLVLVRYNGYMNNSGEAVPGLLRRYRVDPEDFVVIVDNMDLEPGSCKLKKGGGDAGHNGLKSLIRQMGSSDFYRLYIGVGRPSPGISVVDHVLGAPDEEDRRKIHKACVMAADALRELMEKPVSRVMEDLNRRGKIR